MSIAPTTFRPRFIGGPNLGSGINASLLRKLQIAAFWLDQEFAGVTLESIQGSPSGSLLSGGTHAGKGDADDVRLVDSLGRSPSINVWVAFSTMMRLLDCLSYVRGSDVNADGKKDDSFEQHDHVIDREGSKVWAAALQISQYLAHQNGLVGGHPDLEATVNNPLTLAAYTDAEFMLRYQSLSGTAFTLDAHTEPVPTQEDDDMMTWTGPDGTFYAASATRTFAIGNPAVANAINKARHGGQLTQGELDAVLDVQAHLREPAVPVVRATDGSLYAITDKVITLTNIPDAQAVQALRDGAGITPAQASAVARVIGKAV